jgi:hypothetical protein
MGDEARTQQLLLIQAAVFAALGAAAPGCSGGPGSGARTTVELPPQSSATQPVASTAPDRPNHQTGFVKEPNGSIHRASPVSCDTRIDLPACRGDEGHQMCKQDADCKDGPNGRCTSGSGQIGAYCGCTYACENDGDCKAGEACICAAEANEKHSVCATATCKTDADCGSRMCGVSTHDNGCGNEVRLACRTVSDKCTTDADCRKEGGPHGQCAAGRGSDAAWTCQYMSCAIGRPFVVAGAARTAPLEPGGAWLDAELAAALERGASALGPREREAIAARTLEQARLEHASVASFARASLELLALGAPPVLLRDTARAMQDEIEHARVCFAIARAHGAGDLAPRGLDLAGAMPGAVDAARIAYAVAYEGCVGETLGAAEAAEEAREAADAALRDVLATIADDELRHAALAWRTLAWVVATFGDEARAAAGRGIEDGLRDMARGQAGNLARLRGEIARWVIEPAAAQVLGMGGVA